MQTDDSTTNSLRSVKIVTPARKLFAVFCLCLAAWTGVFWIGSMSARYDPRSGNYDPWEVNAQAKSIDRRLAMGEDELHVLLIPEGTLFCNTLYGFAIAELGMGHSEDSGERERAIKKVEWLIRRVEKLATRHPFNQNDHLKPKGGIILAGHTNLLRANYVLLGGQDKTIRADFDRVSQEIFDAVKTSKTGFPECYKGYTWAQDSVFALESLRIHDKVAGTEYSTAIADWVNAVKNHIDLKTGLMVAQVNPETGESIEGARGCAEAWGLAMMNKFDQEFTLQQYERFRDQWFVPFLGCAGVNEWYQGKAEPTNFHAGPVVFGLGMAASGISIATCRANRDFYSQNRLLRSLEFFGLPMLTPTGEKNYMFGVCLLADVVSLWGKTIPVAEGAPQQFDSIKEQPPDNYGIAIGIAAAICALVVGLLARNVWYNFRKDPKVVRPGWRRASVVCFALQVVAIATFLFVPYLTVLQIVFFMALVDMLEELSIRPSIIGKMHREQG